MYLKEEMNISEKLIQCSFDFIDLALRVVDTSISETGLIASIEIRLQENISPFDQCFFHCESGHPDHSIIGEAGWNLFKTGYDILFYQDLPYAAAKEYTHENLHYLLAKIDFLTYHRNLPSEINFKPYNRYSTQISRDWLSNRASLTIDIGSLTNAKPFNKPFHLSNQ